MSLNTVLSVSLRSFLWLHLEKRDYIDFSNKQITVVTHEKERNGIKRLVSPPWRPFFSE